MRRYPMEVKQFIEEHVAGISTRDLVALVNEEFGTEFTYEKMRAFKKNHKLRSGLPGGLPAGGPTKKFPKEVREYIAENHAGIAIQEMTDQLNETFGTQYAVTQIRAFYKNNKIRCGVDHRYQKGNVPFNKGRKGFTAPGCEKGWFKKGHIPMNHLPVGSEIVNTYGYTCVKIAEPNVWEPKHRLIWEETNGKVPEDCVVTFLDGDKQNIKLENLVLLTKAESLELTRSNLRSENADFTETGILVVKVKRARLKRAKEMNEANEDFK